MSTFLALKYAAPSGLLPRAFHALTRARLVTQYPHAGIVRDGILLHSNLARGLHSEPFDSTGWHLFALPADVADQIDTRFVLHWGTPYDWFSLLAFLLPWRVRDRRRMYCFEWCYLAMTGHRANDRITPELLLTRLAQMHQGAA